MLMLTRKYGESLRIGDDVAVTVVSIDKNKVRICGEVPDGGPHRPRGGTVADG